MTKAPVALLADQAAGFGLTIRKKTGTRLEFEVPVQLPDGTAPMFQIRLKATGSKVTAFESGSARLPAFCPERHINPSGSFCLGWDEADDLNVIDAQSAQAFVAKLVKFLKLQLRAQRKRAWPDKRAWAHGDAAQFQREAIQAAAILGADFADAAKRGALTVKKRGNGVLGPALQVSLNHRWVYSVWERDKRVLNLRRPCFVQTPHKKPTVIRECKAHREAAVRLAFALRDWEREEEKFWQRLKGTKCCGTVDHCPLK